MSFADAGARGPVLGSVTPLHYCIGTDSISLFFLLPEDLHSEHILFSLQLVLHLVAAVKRLPVHHHSADYYIST